MPIHSVLQCEYRRLNELKAYPKNARTHSKKQLRQIADSIERFGFTNPILIDGTNMILAGHGRVEAARLLGLSEVPCVRLEHMSAQEKRAYVLADNKLALNAGWDEEILAEELKELLACDLDFDIGLTGFSIAEIDSWLRGSSPKNRGIRKRTGCPRMMDPHAAASATSGSWVRIG